jgi:hypothetical protein
MPTSSGLPVPRTVPSSPRLPSARKPWPEARFPLARRTWDLPRRPEPHPSAHLAGAQVPRRSSHECASQEAQPILKFHREWRGGSVQPRFCVGCAPQKLLFVRPRCARPNGARDKLSCSPAHSAAEQLNEAEIPLRGTPLRFAPWLGGRTHACAHPSRGSAYLARRYTVHR